MPAVFLKRRFCRRGSERLDREGSGYDPRRSGALDGRPDPEGPRPRRPELRRGRPPGVSYQTTWTFGRIPMRAIAVCSAPRTTQHLSVFLWNKPGRHPPSAADPERAGHGSGPPTRSSSPRARPTGQPHRLGQYLAVEIGGQRVFTGERRHVGTERSGCTVPTTRPPR